eukprot:3297401-Amphidinium_carterae.1
MATHTTRKIQEGTNDELCMSQEGESQYYSGPLPGSRAGRGAHTNEENEVMLRTPGTSMNRKKTSLSAVLFDKF